MSCASVSSNTSVPGNDDIKLSAEVPVAVLVAPSPAIPEEAAARSESAVGKEMGSELT